MVILLSLVKRTITEESAMKRVAAKFIPQDGTDHQREQRVKTCRALNYQLQNLTKFIFKLFLVSFYYSGR